MSDRERVEKVVCEWAAIDDIPNTQDSLCDVFKLGPNATSAPCDEALEGLIERLRDAFPDRGLDLRPKDFDDAIPHVDALVAFVMLRPSLVAAAPNLEVARAPEPALEMVLESIVVAAVPVPTPKPRPAPRAKLAKRAAKKPATKKAAKKAVKRKAGKQAAKKTKKGTKKATKKRTATKAARRPKTSRRRATR